MEADGKDRDGQTALHAAAFRGYEAVVRLLVEQFGAGKGLESAQDRSGQTALHCAAMGGHEAIVGLLIGKYGVDKEA
jgi:ankyrin repeat protein